ncbi:TPA: GNAT family N-acetyltransferase [Vibrio vulnificus]|uniref:GNAT family N-acetyltransferase n=1 Tax=Vibrio vulnificus TaxID=672 RepID=UPI001A35E32E|nr:GNAT family N-acetyltransferase [Vibrio vulnificus]HAS6277211.1 GNAT family N-acetyltransferase [Vibrio vulnificus]HDY7540307.1 GNAT family N-acetyltransferase [Vibrio vulnificus]HDY8048843.1 GNAT family N-acetyltransferase [Vibrio vulnificus]HDY8238994.1 GNAT family N-acetyltransferase [Vibrio vulnificus]
MEVVEAEKSDLDSFFVYLENQLSENGNGEVPLFQPMSREQSEIPETTKGKFIQGFSHQFGDLGWRKLWVVKDTSGNIKGHIDLRHHNDESRSHRVLLGMGVDVSCRKQGLGQRLIDAVINFCQEKAEIDWLDLCVLSENFPAKNLYLKAGFNVVGEFKDQYRIDGLSVSETAMTKYVKNYA